SVTQSSRFRELYSLPRPSGVMSQYYRPGATRPTMMSMKVVPEPPPGSGIVSGPVFTGSGPAQSGLGYCGPVMVTKLKHRVTPAATPPDHVPPVNTWIPPPG